MTARVSPFRPPDCRARDITRRSALRGLTAAVATTTMHGASFAQIAGSGIGRTTAIDAVLQAAVASREVPGVVVMASNGHAIIHQGAFGARQIGTDAAMTIDTVFRIGSMVKLLTSIGAMQLVERGKLKLDEPVPPIDPAVANPQVLTGYDAGKPQLRAAHRAITLRHLLTHTSGLSYRLWDSKAARYTEAAGKDPKLPRTPLMFDPGERWVYGTGIDWAGKLVTAASGQPLDRYFRDNICGPLGMRDTSFTVSDEQRRRQAHLHVRKGDRTLTARPLEKHMTVRSISGGGGIYSSAPDYLTLLTTLLNEGKHRSGQLLRPETVALMHANQIGNIGAGVMKTMNPAVSNDVDFFPGQRLRWSLGHMINLDPVSGGRSAGSLTWAGLYNTYYWIDPTRHVAAVLMTQILPFADRPALKVYRQYERELYRALTPA